MFRSFRNRLILYTVLALGVLGLTPVLFYLDPGFIGHAWRDRVELFTLFAFGWTLLTIAVVFVEVRIRRAVTFGDLQHIVLPALVVTLYAYLVTFYFWHENYDYGCYSSAAMALQKEESMYGHGYLYTPVLAYILYAAFHLISAVAGFLNIHVLDAQIWLMVFYFYKCSQVLFLAGSIILSLYLARNLGIGKSAAVYLVSALFLFNVPLISTLYWGQVNLVILFLFLASIAWLPRSPFMAGIVVGAGGMVKYYMLALVVPWIREQNWKALVGLVAGVCIVFIVTLLSVGASRAWSDFFALQFLPEINYSFWNRSILSFVYAFLTICIPGLRSIDSPAESIAIISHIVAIAVTGIYFLVRLHRRCLVFKSVRTDGRDEVFLNTFRLQYSNAADFLALAVFVSPLLWTHHFVLVMPLAIAAFIANGQNRKLLFLLASFLIFGLPMFDVFPFSYAGLAGVALLFWLTSPSEIKPAIARIE